MATITEKPPSTRKYEVGTAYDATRIFRDPTDQTVFELGDRPSARDLYTMINSDAQAHQLAKAARLPIKIAKWEFLKGEGDTGERDFIEYALHASAKQGGMTTPFRQIIGQISNALIYRFQAFEKVWKVSDREPYKNKVILHKLGWRPTTTCMLRTDKNGSFNGFQQVAYKGNEYKKVNFDPKRSFVYINGADEQPQVGTSSFETIYKAYLNKLKVSFFYFAFLENVAFPRTMVKSLNDDPEELAALLDKTRQLSHQGIIGLYSHEEMTPYESQRTTRDYQNALEYLDWQMAKAMLAQFLDLGTTGERGSYALSRDKSEFFFNSIEAVLHDIEEAINNYIIADLIQYNYGVNASYPRIRFRPLNDEAADAVLETYRQVIMANSPNVTPTFMLQLMNRVEDILQLEIDPMAEYDAETLRQIQETIPTAQEHMESKESRAGSGRNPITGKDRNNNRVTDNVDIVAQGAPKPTTNPRRKRDD